MFTLRATVHTTTQCLPAKLVFRQYPFLNRRHDIDWEVIREQKQDLINKGNKCTKYNQTKYIYKKR